MEQQTAVAILEEKLKTYLSWSSFLEEDFEQAKAMEKEQIMNAANTLLYRGTGPGDMWAEQYYNETYNK